MGNCYSADHIAEDHIQIDMACNTEEPQQKFRHGTVSYRLLGVLELGLLNPFFTYFSILNHKTKPNKPRNIMGNSCSADYIF